jgi:hypothetical protein
MNQKTNPVSLSSKYHITLRSKLAFTFPETRNTC